MPHTIKSFCRDTTAAIAISFAILAPVLIGSAGMALDFSQAYLVQQRLAQALDAAALAGSAHSTDPAEIEAKIREFFEANYPDGRIGDAFEPDVTVTADEVIVSGRAAFNTYFLRLIGIDTIDVSADTTVQRDVQGLEVVLVLDNTGSMSENDNITSLKTATNNFIDILFDSTSDDEYIKIGMVPFANGVRVGSYGLGKNPDGSTYGDGRTFVNLPSGYTTTTDHQSTSGTKWFGCVLEHNEAGWNSAITTNDPYPHDVLDDTEGPWEIYRYEQYKKTGSSCSWKNGRYVCTDTYGYVVYTYPAQNCPYAQVVPLTSDRAKLESAVTSMKAHGNTLVNIGTAWGYRVISPEFPFEEAAAWDNEYWRKAVIIMTDGDNTRDSHYSAFWRNRNNQIVESDYDERLGETCEALKEQGVTVYTVTFYSNIGEETKDIFRACASSEDQYYDAPTQEELVAVFERISRELSNLHISP